MVDRCRQTGVPCGGSTQWPFHLHGPSPRVFVTSTRDHAPAGSPSDRCVRPQRPLLGGRGRLCPSWGAGWSPSMRFAGGAGFWRFPFLPRRSHFRLPEAAPTPVLQTIRPREASGPPSCAEPSGTCDLAKVSCRPQVGLRPCAGGHHGGDGRGTDGTRPADDAAITSSSVHFTDVSRNRGAPRLRAGGLRTKPPRACGGTCTGAGSLSSQGGGLGPPHLRQAC